LRTQSHCQPRSVRFRSPTATIVFRTSATGTGRTDLRRTRSSLFAGRTADRDAGALSVGWRRGGGGATVRRVASAGEINGGGVYDKVGEVCWVHSIKERRGQRRGLHSQIHAVLHIDFLDGNSARYGLGLRSESGKGQRSTASAGEVNGGGVCWVHSIKERRGRRRGLHSQIPAVLHTAFLDGNSARYGLELRPERGKGQLAPEKSSATGRRRTTITMPRNGR